MSNLQLPELDAQYKRMTFAIHEGSNSNELIIIRHRKSRRVSAKDLNPPFLVILEFSLIENGYVQRQRDH